MHLRQRDTYWDTLKGLLIFLVVLGHTGSCLGERWTSVIYVFHMPLFIFVSGYFSGRKKNEKFMEGIKMLLVFYLLFHALYLVYDFKTGNSLSLGRLLTPSFGLWYLLSLCYWRCITQFFHTSLERFPVLFIMGAILLSVGTGFIPIDSQMSFQRTFTFLPFFLFGYYTKQFNWIERIKQWNPFFVSSFIVVLLGIVYYSIPPFYANTHFKEMNDCWIRCQQMVLALLICICMIRIVPKRIPVVTQLGTYTLIVYLFHPPLILLGKRLLDCFRIPHHLFTGIVIAVVVIAFISFIRDWKFVRFFNR